MRVLIVSQYFWPENFRINDLTFELVRRGHDVSILTGIPNYPKGEVFEVFRRDRKAFASYMGAKVYRVPIFSRGSGSIRLILNYLSFVVSGCIFGPWLLHKQTFDVIFVYEPSPVTVGLPAILLGRIKHAPIIFWVQDLWPESLVAVGKVRSTKAIAAIGLLVRFIYRNCALVLGQSQGFLLKIVEYCPDATKVRYFPNWAEDIFNFDRVTPAPEVPLQTDVFNIVFAGNVGEAQDFPAILNAVELLGGDRAIRWIIVGEGRMFDWLREEVLRRNLEHSFLLLGRFPLDRMPSFYVHADALFLSLKSDPIFSLTIPGKLQSYLMSGIPVLGMLDGEGAKVVHNSNAGLVCPAGDFRQLALIVDKMASLSSFERRQLGENGREYALREFSRQTLISRLEMWFSELVGVTQI